MGTYIIITMCYGCYHEYCLHNIDTRQCFLQNLILYGVMCMETQYHRGGGNDTKYTCTYVHVYTESVAHDAGGGNLGREWKIAVHSLLCMKPCNDVHVQCHVI